jgi:hypothetical protein
MLPGLIAADESVQFRDDERVDYSHVISLKHVGDTLNLKILRDGEVHRFQQWLCSCVCAFGIWRDCVCLGLELCCCGWLMMSGWTTAM